MPDKMLYLDIDMMARKDISELYNIDVSKYEYAAVREKYGSKMIRPDYINAGMLLLNMKEIKETGLLKRARTLIKRKNTICRSRCCIFGIQLKKNYFQENIMNNLDLIEKIQ